MKDDDKINGYKLTKMWFNFALENPELINTNHCALWFWIIELCNRLAWKEKFGLPTVHSMEILGIKSYNTYKKTLDDLIKWEFIRLVEKSKNQYTTNIIALSIFNKAYDKALDKAFTEQCIKHNDIDKQSIKTIETIKPIMSDAFSTDYTPINNFDSLAYKLWKQCHDDRVAKGIKPTTLQKAKPEVWAGEIKLLIEKDERTEMEINEVLDFLKTDDFWSRNIESTVKLRKQFERLQQEMRTPRKTVINPGSIKLDKQDYTLKPTEI